MKRNTFFAGFLVVTTSLVVTGCATTRAKKPDPNAAQTQIMQLQSELQAKDQQIQDLQYQLQSTQSPVSYSGYGTKSKLIKVSGVSVADVQRALKKAGYDPGPVDGQAGKKTKKAIKAFQRDHGLSADGVVGQKTWSKLS